jgi:ring-1,2-phenylacetyl-CoA epoxidase subunit PaaD
MKTVKSDNRSIEEQRIWNILGDVKDPEVPVLSVLDLGIVRAVKTHPAPVPTGLPMVTITITPTYSGCPALDAIRTDIRLKLLEYGYDNVTIEQSLSPAWTTDWMTEEGKRKLKESGIAPPNARHQFCNIKDFFEEEAVQCPLCHSFNTKLISRFGSTACKAIYQCSDCGETFDYFKCH